MTALYVRGGQPLRGRIEPSANKNAVLPILCSTLLSREPIRLLGIPEITDVRNKGMWGKSGRIVGRALTVNGHPLTFVGVAPRGFTGTTLGVRPQDVKSLADVRGVKVSYLFNLFDYWGTVVTSRPATEAASCSCRTANRMRPVGSNT